MKKRLLALLLAVPFVIAACGTTADQKKETEAPVVDTETETEEVYELSPDYVGWWVTGENEDTTVISIGEDLTWQVVNVDEIEGFEEIGGCVKVLEDAVELDNGDEVYDTVFFGSEGELYSENGYTYAPYYEDAVEVIDEYVGAWQTGENEDMSYLVICEDETWKEFPADEIEGAEEFGGNVVLTEDSLELYNGDELYNTVFFGAEENTLYSSLGYEYVLVSKDYNEIGD